MLAINLPVGETFYTQRVTLAGSDFQLSMRWNQRESFWYMSLADAEGVPLISGRKVVCNFPLLARVTDARRPAGELMAMDMSGAGADPGYSDFGTRVLLTFWED